MLFIPKKFKFKKRHKGKTFRRTDSLKHFKNINFFSIKFVSLESVRFNTVQFKAFFLNLRKALKKKGMFNLFLFPHFPISKKPVEVRMGKGKGNVDTWVFNIKPGFSICEIKIKNFSIGVKALKKVQMKIGFKTRIFFF